jgi:hypothetical protein
MNIQNDIKGPSNSGFYHANIVLGGKSSIVELKIRLGNLGFEIERSPDFLEYKVDTFGIDEARFVKEWLEKKAMNSERKAVLVVSGLITLEAQNSLLKIVEEPPIGTYIFFSLRNLTGIISTLLSRVHIIDLKNYLDLDTEKESLAQEFLKMSTGERLERVKELAKNEDKNTMKEIIIGLEKNMYKKDDINNVKKALIAKKLASIRGASLKMILDWMSIVAK